MLSANDLVYLHKGKNGFRQEKLCERAAQDELSVRGIRFRRYFNLLITSGPQITPGFVGCSTEEGMKCAFSR